MLINLRNRLPDIEDARDVAVERITKAANSAAQTARDASELLEDWALEGLDSVRSRPLMWAAASLGLGVLIGGLFAVWQTGRPHGQAARRSVAVRTPSKPKRRAARTRRLPSA